MTAKLRFRKAMKRRRERRIAIERRALRLLLVKFGKFYFLSQ